MDSEIGVPYVAFTEDGLRRRIVDAAIAFTDACTVCRDDGQFQVNAVGAGPEAQTLWNMIGLWRLTYGGDGE